MLSDTLIQGPLCKQIKLKSFNVQTTTTATTTTTTTIIITIIIIIIKHIIYTVTYSWVLYPEMQGTQDHKNQVTHFKKANLKRWVFNWDLNLAVEVASLSSSGRVFTVYRGCRWECLFTVYICLVVPAGPPGCCAWRSAEHVLGTARVRMSGE